MPTRRTASPGGSPAGTWPEPNRSRLSPWTRSRSRCPTVASPRPTWPTRSETAASTRACSSSWTRSVCDRGSQEMADRIASWGYVVLAPNVFYRDGSAADERRRTWPTSTARPGDATVLPGSHAAGRTGSRRTRRRADIAAYLDGAAHPPRRRGRTGGHGRLLHGCAPGGPRRHRHPDPTSRPVGGFHGGGLVTDDRRQPAPGSAVGPGGIRLRPRRQRPVDGQPTRSRPWGRRWTTRDSPLSNEVYPGAGHGYTMADTAVFDETATERHFEELKTLLARRL